VEIADVLVDTTKQKMYEIKPAMEVKRPLFDFYKSIILDHSIACFSRSIGILLYQKEKETRRI